MQYILNIERALELGILALPPKPPSPPAGDGRGAANKSNDADSAENGVLFKRFLALLPPTTEGQLSQRDVLQFILEHEGTTVPVMAKHFRVTTSVVVGTINGGLQRNIKKAGFSDRNAILIIAKQGGEWHYYAGAVLTAFWPHPFSDQRGAPGSYQ